ncbi:hypothetical protein CERSUDRAFT_123287 [Gelatoporia subvermispora B]|uniref:DUF6534 domain-containing protein n=1 Tax=Ceriporiopsis subvermispora (strain B) TaxID=914234 RepID=M2PLN7_CERS8|nr:hypothetical protein CERSUDRAFT_123287 [Gelatoporia subvermispora B]
MMFHDFTLTVIVRLIATITNYIAPSSEYTRIPALRVTGIDPSRSTAKSQGNMGAFDLILGPILMGTIVNTFLMGVMLVQCYVYFMRFNGDKWWMKPMVWFLLFMDTLSSCLYIYMSYAYLVTNFGNIPAIEVANAGVLPYPLLTGITALVVQFYFAWRVKLLIRSPLLTYSIVILSCVQMLASLGTTIGGVIVKDFASLIKVKQISLVWLFGSVVTDTIITVSLVWYLRRNRTGFSNHLTDRLIRLILQTGLLTTTCALGVVIAYLVSESTVHLAFGVPLSKLYTNSLMSSLNARKGWNPDDFTRASTFTTRSAPVKTEVRMTTFVESDTVHEGLQLTPIKQKNLEGNFSTNVTIMA